VGVNSLMSSFQRKRESRFSKRRLTMTRNIFIAILLTALTLVFANRATADEMSSETTAIKAGEFNAGGDTRLSGSYIVKDGIGGDLKANIRYKVPTSSITYPADGAALTGTSITITGTADAPYGVGHVIITPDGGKTWFDTTGTTTWSYLWKFPSNGTFNIRTQTVDSNGDVETPGPGVTVNVINNYMQLIVNSSPKTGGTVTTNNPGIGGWYPLNTIVRLTETPNADYDFVKWTGAQTGKTNPVNITMSAKKTITAVFRKVATTLDVSGINGKNVTLVANLNINGSSARGRNINFYENTNGGNYALKGQALTDINGTAKKTYASTAGDHLAYAVVSMASTDPFFISPVGSVSNPNPVELPTTESVSYHIEKVNLTSPGLIVTEPSPALSWDSYPGAEYYHVQVAWSSGFGLSYILEDVDTENAATSYTLTKPVVLGRQYYWRVQAALPGSVFSMYSDTRKLAYKNATNLTLEYVGKVGSVVTLKATLRKSTDGSVIPGKTIYFYENSNGGLFVSKGSAVTGALTSVTPGPGIAKKSWTTAAGTHNASAKFAGDATNAAAETDPATVSY